MDKEIDLAFGNSVDFLVKTQKEDGSWSSKKEPKYREPPVYLKELVETSRCVGALILMQKRKGIASIKSGLRFCIDYNLESHDAVDLWAHKLEMLKFTNISSDEKAKTAKHLCERQKKGRWESYPTTFNLTNYSVLLSLMDFDCKDTFEKSIAWFKKTKAGDGIGWGKDDTAKESEYTFTSNVIIALAATGEDLTAAYVQKAKKWLENGQLQDGSWHSAKLTTEKPTTYATAVAVVALMLASDEPVNKKVENGIAFLVKAVSKNGGWPLVKGEEPRFYTTYYAAHTIALYKYMKLMWDKPEILLLRKQLKPQQVSAYLFNSFLSYLKKKLKIIVLLDSLDSKALGTTSKAVERRKEMLKILAKGGIMDVAAIIDELKKLPDYAGLNKKSHLTQIKSDLEYLRDIHLVSKTKYEYFVSFDALNFN